MRLLMVLAALLLAAPASAMGLGVNTHFAQGWSLRAMALAAEAKAGSIRDEVGWGGIEKTPGTYDWRSHNVDYLVEACRRRLAVTVVLHGRHPLYDNRETVHTPAARQALARFAVALVERFPCIRALEIGNEINGKGGVTGPVAKGLPDSYVAILRDLRGALGTSHRQVALLGGSTNLIAVGFLERLFAAGMLPLVDGVVVHPYHPVPESQAEAIARLKAAMRRHGGEKPIWATEFGLSYPTPEAAPPHALKLIAILAAGGVAQAQWYALLEEKWYPNMGLFAGTFARPALATFQLAAGRVLPQGAGVREDVGDPLSFVYRFGSVRVMWGSARALSFTGRPVVRDARGKVIAAPGRLGDDPIVVEGDYRFTLGPRPVLADSLTGFALDGWSYGLRDAAGRERPLRWIDWAWNSYIGAGPGGDPMASQVMITAPAGRSVLVERYLAPQAGATRLQLCAERRAKQGSVTVTVSHNGRVLGAERVVTTGRATVDLVLAAGDRIEIAYAGEAVGPRGLRRRVQLVAGGVASAVLCPPPPLRTA